MSVTELDPLFGALHANGAAAATAEPPPPTPVPDPAAALVTDPGDDGVTQPAPELEQPGPAPQHDPDLQPVDLEHDPLTAEDEAEDLDRCEVVTDSAPDFDDDEPVANVEVDYDDEAEQLELPTPPTIAASPSPATGGVFAAFTPQIPQPRLAPAAPVAQPAGEQPPTDASPLKLRLPGRGALQSSRRRLAARGRRSKKRTTIGLLLLAVGPIAAAVHPGKGPTPTASKPAPAAATSPAATPTKPAPHDTRKRVARVTSRAAAPRQPRGRSPVRTRVVIRRVVVPAPAAASAPAAAPVPSSAPVWRAPATAAASEFRP
jgi:hypothetical protein